jgi:hypothetical protein
MRACAKVLRTYDAMPHGAMLRAPHRSRAHMRAYTKAGQTPWHDVARILSHMRVVVKLHMRTWGQKIRRTDGQETRRSVVTAHLRYGRAVTQAVRRS